MTARVRARFGILIIALACTAVHARVEAQSGTTTVILVRHAERAAEPRDDPGLTAQGEARARALIDAVGKSGIAAIYSTQYLRTRSTAEPLARALGLEVQLVDAGSSPMGSGGATHAEQVAERIRRENTGNMVLVVGHSNTVPAIIEALGAGSVGAIQDNEYDNLFIVFLRPDGSARLVRAKYGERSATD
ncbi:MAG: SixA phosphatase family protein [Longimicrobiales bacterium]